MNWKGNEILKRDLQPYEPNKIRKTHKIERKKEGRAMQIYLEALAWKIVDWPYVLRWSNLNLVSFMLRVKLFPIKSNIPFSQKYQTILSD